VNPVAKAVTGVRASRPPRRAHEKTWGSAQRIGASGPCGCPPTTGPIEPGAPVWPGGDQTAAPDPAQGTGVPARFGGMTGRGGSVRGGRHAAMAAPASARLESHPHVARAAAPVGHIPTMPRRRSIAHRPGGYSRGYCSNIYPGNPERTCHLPHRPGEPALHPGPLLRGAPCRQADEAGQRVAKRVLPRDVHLEHLWALAGGRSS
jgi:hypothetical protein